MATRLYFPSSGAAPVTPSTWLFASQVSSPLTYKAVATKISSAFATKSGATATTLDLRGVGRWVIGPLGATQISGTIKGQFRCTENNDGAAATLAVAIKIIQPSGADRATLLSPVASDADTTRPPEMLVGTTPNTGAANRSFNNTAESASISLTPQTPTSGDYLVIEVGFRSNTGTSRTIYLRYGDNNANDNPENQTDTNDYCPWIEFSNTLPLNATVTPGFAPATSSAYSAAILAGAVSLGLGLGSATAVAYNAGITAVGENQTITPTYAQATAAAYEVSRTTAVSLTPGVAAAVGGAFSASIQAGGVTIVPGAASATGGAYAAGIQPGPVTITSTYAQATAAAYEVSRTTAVTLTPGVAAAVGGAFSASIQAGGVTISEEFGPITVIPGGGYHYTPPAPRRHEPREIPPIPDQILKVGFARASARAFDPVSVPGRMIIPLGRAQAKATAWSNRIDRDEFEEEIALLYICL